MIPLILGVVLIVVGVVIALASTEGYRQWRARRGPLYQPIVVDALAIVLIAAGVQLGIGIAVIR